MFQKNTGLPVLAFPHFHLLRLLEGDLNDQAPLKMSWVLRVFELEEDLEWSISCLKRCRGC